MYIANTAYTQNPCAIDIPEIDEKNTQILITRKISSFNEWQTKETNLKKYRRQQNDTQTHVALKNNQKLNTFSKCIAKEIIMFLFVSLSLSSRCGSFSFHPISIFIACFFFSFKIAFVSTIEQQEKQFFN